MKKTCKCCQEEKEIELFSIRASSKDGYRNICKVCRNIQMQPSIEKWKINNKEKVRQIHKNYRKSHRELYRECQKGYYDKNKKEIYEREYKLNPQRRMYKILMSRMNRTIKDKHGKRIISTWELVGCDYETLKQHIEKKWLPNMSWDNYGFGDNKWHIDHILPCSSFDLTLDEQQKKCFHYTNLQPLWQFDNLSKHNKIP